MLFAVNIGDSLQQGFDTFFAFIPNLLAFLVILAIGYIIAKAVRTIINKLLDRVGVDRALHRSDAGQYIERVSPGARPSHLIGATVFWFIFLFAITAAVGALRIPALTNFLTQVQAFLPRIIVAVLIFVLAAVLAGAIGGAVQKLMGDTPTGKIVRAVVPGLILAIGLFMVLDQLQIAPVIVTITYAALLGFLALAGALAFGLGGRDAAAQLLSGAVQAGQQNAGQVRQDMQVGRDRAQQQAQQTQQQAQDRLGDGPRRGSVSSDAETRTQRVAGPDPSQGQRRR
ncbi:MAG: transporter [Actinomycetota bacterium]|nr:transporter [Actinomycetota bacterium]